MRRGPRDIEADILRIADAGARKTEIVYKCNLNFKLVKKYLRGLIDRRLLHHDEERATFLTTPLGREFLRRYHALLSMDTIPPIHAV